MGVLGGRAERSESRKNIRFLSMCFRCLALKSPPHRLKVTHIATGSTFLALVPFVNTLRKSVGNSTGVSFELDGSITIRAGDNIAAGSHISFDAGLFNDAEFFSRYYEVPGEINPFNGIKLALPGTLTAGSKFNFCLKDAKASRRDECRDG